MAELVIRFNVDELAREIRHVIAAVVTSDFQPSLQQAAMVFVGSTSRAPVSAEEAKASLFTVLRAPGEALAVREALRTGMLEGKNTADCLIAIVAECRGMHYQELVVEIGRTPIETWVIEHVHWHDTPETSEHAWLLDSWLAEWLDAAPPEDIAAAWEQARERIMGAVTAWWDEAQLLAPSAPVPQVMIYSDMAALRKANRAWIASALGVPRELLTNERRE